MFIYKYLQGVLTTLCFTFQIRDLFSAHTPLVRYPFYTTPLCSNFSSQKPIVHSILTSQVKNPTYTLFSLLKSETQCTLYPLHWNALPYISKFDGQTAFGIYGLAATYGHNNTTQALQPCCFEHKCNTHTK